MTGEHNFECLNLASGPPHDGFVAIQNRSGSISCIVVEGWVGCETEATNWPRRDDGEQYHGVKLSADGSFEWADGQLGDTPRNVIVDGVTYRAQGWTITSEGETVIFRSDTTGKVFRVGPTAVCIDD